MKNIASIEAAIESSLKEMPAVALAVVSGDEIYTRGFGRTSCEPEHSLPVTGETLFLIGSVTKPLTATAVMRLVEKGVMELDRPITEYLNDLSFRDPAYGRTLTIRHLLSHTAGLPSWDITYGQSTCLDPEGLGQVLQRIVPTLGFVCPPGRAWLYSSPGYSLAGLVAERIYGESFSQLMHNEVFAPLHMERSTFDPLVAMTHPLALPHTRNEQQEICIAHRFHLSTVMAPAGMAFCSLHDLALFARMQLQRGLVDGEPYLLPQTIDQMQSLQVPTYTLADGGYGLGFFLDTYKGIRRVWHDGAWANMRGHLYLAPERQTAVLLCCDGVDWSFPINRFVNELFDLLLDLPTEEPTPPVLASCPDRDQWQRYVGDYLDIYENGLVSIRVEEEQLLLLRFGRTVALTPLRSGVYTGRDEEATIAVGFVAQKGEEPLALIVVNEMPCMRDQREEGFLSDDAWLQQFVGHYTGSHTIILRFDLDEHALYAWMKEWKKEFRCTPIDHTRIHGGGIGLLTFSHDELGRLQMDVARLFTLIREEG